MRGTVEVEGVMGLEVGVRPLPLHTSLELHVLPLHSCGLSDQDHGPEVQSCGHKHRLD